MPKNVAEFSLKNAVLSAKMPIDLLGTPLNPGDIVAYASTNDMRIGIFIGLLINKSHRLSASLCLVGEAASGHIINIPINLGISDMLLDEPITIPKTIFINSEFHTNNNLILNAMKCLEDLQEAGILAT